MLKYAEIKTSKEQLLALTGLTRKEFEVLLPAFEEIYQVRYEGELTQTGQPRQRKAGGGRNSGLDGIEQKLLFILVYHKTYPIQVVMGAMFGVSQSRASDWIHRLMPVLRDALTKLGYAPEREGRKFAQHERMTKETPDYVIDGTDRPRNRPQKAEMQALHYSGKKKRHTDKNIVISHRKSKRIGYLSPTYPGTVHDKRLAEHETIRYPRQTHLHKDTGFQGYEPKVTQSLQPQKNQKAAS